MNDVDSGSETRCFLSTTRTSHQSMETHTAAATVAVLAAAAAAAPNDAGTPPRAPEPSIRDICTWTQSQQRGRNFRNPAAGQFIFYFFTHTWRTTLMRINSSSSRLRVYSPLGLRLCNWVVQVHRVGVYSRQIHTYV